MGLHIGIGLGIDVGGGDGSVPAGPFYLKTTSGGFFLQTDGVGKFRITGVSDITVSANIQTLLSSADFAAARTNLGLTALATTTPGTGVATFLTTPSSANFFTALTTKTGTGIVVFASSPSLTSPDLGTPSAGALSNCSAFPVSQITGTGTNVLSALQSFSSANIAAACTDETGFSSGALLVFSKSPTIDAPTLTNTTTIATLNVTTANATTITGALSDVTNSVTTPTTTAAGYLGAPQSSKSADYTLVLSDSGKEIFHPVGDNNARAFTVPANSSVAFPIGTLVKVKNMAATACTIPITTDTMTLIPAGTTGTRTLAQYGEAVLEKITSTAWTISGNSGLT